MRVVLVCDFTSGLVSRILDVYKHFVKEPEIILVRRPRSDPVSHTAIYKTIEIPVSFSIDLPYLTMLIPFAIRATIYLIYVLLSLPILAADRSIRLVHAHFLLPQGLAGLLISRAVRAPLILTATGSDVNQLAGHVLPRTVMQCILFRKSSCIIAVSQDLREKLESLGCKNAIYIPNCVEIPRCSSAGERDMHRVIFVGNLIAPKRPQTLVLAFNKVAKQIPDATLTIVGSGPMRQYLEKLSSSFGLKDRIFFTGYLGKNQLVDIYRKPTVFVLPSISEGMSTALLEAMSFGSCIIVSEPASSGLIRHEIDGLVFRLDDVDDLAEKIMSIFHDEGRRKRLSASARRRCEQEYSVEAVAPQLEQTYAGILSLQSVRRCQ